MKTIKNRMPLMDTRPCFLLYPEKAAEVCSLSYTLLFITSLQ